MANYYESDPAPFIDRVRYFDNEFLKDQDFIDEQVLHLAASRRHDRWLHLAGVLDGLAISAVAGPGIWTATIAPGVAYDGLGREILLAPAGALPGLSKLPIQKFDETKLQSIYIVFNETEGGETQTGSGGVKGFTRFVQTPQLIAADPATPATIPENGVLLAEVDVNRNVTDTRQFSGVGLPSPAAHVTLRSDPTLRADWALLTGSLAVNNGFSVNGPARLLGSATVQNGLTVSSGTLSVAGAAQVGGGLTAQTGLTVTTGGLTVKAGVTTFADTVAALKGLSVSGDNLGIGANSQLIASGNSRFFGDVTFNGWVHGDEQRHIVNMDGHLSVGGDFNLSGNAAIDTGTLRVGRLITVNGGMDFSGSRLHMNGRPIYLRSGTGDIYDIIHWNPSFDGVHISGFNGVQLGSTAAASDPNDPKTIMQVGYNTVDVSVPIKFTGGSSGPGTSLGANVLGPKMFARAWGNVQPNGNTNNGFGQPVVDSYNVSNCFNVGNFIAVTFATPMADANYIVVMSYDDARFGNNGIFGGAIRPYVTSAGQFFFKTHLPDGTYFQLGSASGVHIFFVVFAKQ